MATYQDNDGREWSIPGDVAGIGVAIGAATAAVTGFVALLASPVSVAMFGAVTAAAYLMRDDLTNAFDDSRGAWDTLVAAVAAGDLTGAFKVMGSEIEVVWSTLIDALLDKWEAFRLSLDMAGLTSRDVDGVLGRQMAELEERFKKHSNLLSLNFDFGKANDALSELNRIKKDFLLETNAAVQQRKQNADQRQAELDALKARREAVLEEVRMRAAALEREKALRGALPPLEEMPGDPGRPFERGVSMTPKELLTGLLGKAKDAVGAVGDKATDLRKRAETEVAFRRNQLAELQARAAMMAEVAPATGPGVQGGFGANALVMAGAGGPQREMQRDIREIRTFLAAARVQWPRLFRAIEAIRPPTFGA